MRMILLLVVVSVLSTVQVGHGAVVVNNVSSFNVSVFDVNTTIIIDILGPGQTTSFPLDTAGPDLFVVTNEDKADTFSTLVGDGSQLNLSGKRRLKYKIQPKQPSPQPAPAAAPSSNSGGVTVGG